MKRINFMLLIFLATPTAHAATLASNGFEDVAGELPYVASVSNGAQGQIITQSNPPVYSGSQSLMFDKQGDQPQIDFSVVFDPVDLTGYFDVAFEFHWHANINNNPYEAADFLTFTIGHDGAGGPIVINLDNNDLNAARNGNSTDEWQDIFESIPDDATTLNFSIDANFNAENEDIFFDQLVVTGTAPEPASIALWTLLGLIGLSYGWRKFKR